MKKIYKFIETHQKIKEVKDDGKEKEVEDGTSQELRECKLRQTVLL